MAAHAPALPAEVLATLRAGGVIPAHPLALTARRDLDVRRQRALTRYYLDAGASGLAVGVHTTQFAIRDAGLYELVLEVAAETAAAWTERPIVKIAGLVGRTDQALREAETARGLGYHAGLLSLAAMRAVTEDELIEHCAAIATRIPVVGFYLQPAVGGVVLPASFWRRFALIPNVVAIKIAPFNRYRTLDVVRGVIEAGAEERITLLTGNDDHIVLDLLPPFRFRRAPSGSSSEQRDSPTETDSTSAQRDSPTETGSSSAQRDSPTEEEVTVRIAGGLLGHWCVWTRRAVEIVARIKRSIDQGALDPNLLALDAAVTDCNGAFFDVAHDFRGCIAGCHEVLRRQGLLEGTWCLDPQETLSPGQSAEIDRVYRAYPQLNDDAFVRANLERWLG